MDVFVDIYLNPWRSNASVSEGEQAELVKISVITNVIYLSVSLTILTFGIPGNLLTILVLSQSEMKDNVFSVYLISLCFFNVLILVWSVPKFILNVTHGRDIYFQNPNFCGFYRVISIALLCIANWHLILITGSRLCIILDKHRKLVYLYEHPLRMIFCLIVVVLALQIPLVLAWVQYVNDEGEPVECFLPAKSYLMFVEIISQTILSAVILIVLNTTIYILHKRQKPGVVESKQASDLRQKLLLLALVSSAQYLISNVPMTVVAPNADRMFNTKTALGRKKASLAIGVTILLAYANHGTNFLVYCFFGQQFRHELFKLLRRILPTCLHRSLTVEAAQPSQHSASEITRNEIRAYEESVRQKTSIAEEIEMMLESERDYRKTSAVDAKSYKASSAYRSSSVYSDDYPAPASSVYSQEYKV